MPPPRVPKTPPGSPKGTDINPLRLKPGTGPQSTQRKPKSSKYTRAGKETPALRQRRRKREDAERKQVLQAKKAGAKARATARTAREVEADIERLKAKQKSAKTAAFEARRKAKAVFKGKTAAEKGKPAPRKRTRASAAARERGLRAANPQKIFYGAEDLLPRYNEKLLYAMSKLKEDDPKMLPFFLSQATRIRLL